MVFWIFGGVISFILFIIGVVILFFPKKRKVGAIILGSSTVLMIASIIGIIVAFKNFQDVQDSVRNFSMTNDSGESSATESKTYPVNFKQTDNQIESKITSIKVEKKAIYSSLEDKELPGSVTVALEITNHGDKKVTTYPNQGELKTPKESVNGGDMLLSTFDDSEIEKGKTISGELVFPISKIDKVSDIKWISLSWLSYVGDSLSPITIDTGQITLK
ncbi:MULTISPECIES: DUF4352 domain-containing protein [Listeria]|uniref:DUF4352 domain-containing protein n=1 Tax=Listeria TaxID=1637 RepID=UPI000B58CC95|nr:MULTISPECIES: DUF4352 domain-containing protein [Listeria]